jgi:large subunit ribosomal protein L30
MAEKIVIIRIRGVRNMKPRQKKTFELLRLERPNHCVVMEATPQTMGMVNVIKDYVTFGKVSDKTLSSLDAKRGKAKPETDGRKPVYRLHPPKKGIKNIKLPWPSGVLGKRDDMDQFIRNMI